MSETIPNSSSHSGYNLMEEKAILSSNLVLQTTATEHYAYTPKYTNSKSIPASCSFFRDNLLPEQASVSTEDAARVIVSLQNEPPPTATEQYAYTSKHIMPDMVLNTLSKTVPKSSLSVVSLSQEKATFFSERPTRDSLYLQNESPQPSPNGTLHLKCTSKYPKSYFETRFQCLMDITIRILHLISKQITSPDQTETWLLDNSMENSSLADFNRSFIRELIAKFHSVKGNTNPVTELSFRRYVQDNYLYIKNLARYMQNVPNIPISYYSSLNSLGLHELKNKFQLMIRLNNARLLQWSCDMLGWSKIQMSESSPDEAESECKIMYTNIYEVLDLIKSVINIRRRTIAPNELEELNDLISVASETTSLYTSFYAEVRHIKYIIEDIESKKYKS